MKNITLIVLTSIFSGCGIQLGNGDHDRFKGEAQTSSDTVKVEPLDPGKEVSAALYCQIASNPAKASYTEVGCRLAENGKTLSGANYSYENATSAQISIVDQSDGIIYGVSAESNEASLKAALELKVTAKIGSKSFDAKVQDLLQANWLKDSKSTNANGGCSGESCVIANSSDNSFWVRASAGLHPFVEADQSCANLTYGSYDDWRLPSESQLRHALEQGLAFADGFQSRFKENFPGTIAYWAKGQADGEVFWVEWKGAGQAVESKPLDKSSLLGVLCVR